MTFDRRLALARAKQHLLLNDAVGEQVQRVRILSVGGALAYEAATLECDRLKHRTDDQSLLRLLRSVR